MRRITEGKATFDVPEMSLTRKSEAFYNPGMGYQRDVTMSALRAYQSQTGRKLSVCDPLAGTGVRSLRIALEVPGIAEIAANDANPRAFELIRKNIRMSKAPKSASIDVTNNNANALFLENATSLIKEVQKGS